MHVFFLEPALFHIQVLVRARECKLANSIHSEAVQSRTDLEGKNSINKMKNIASYCTKNPNPAHNILSQHDVASH